MVLDDLHARLEATGPRTIDLRRDGAEEWRCQMFTGMHSGDYGEGRGRNIAEAIEGALDDLERGEG